MTRAGRWSGMSRAGARGGGILAAALLPLLFFVQAAEADTLRGVVLEAAGEPVAGARVWLSQDRRVRVQDTDADGAFSFGGLGVGPIEVVARNPGHAIAGYSGMFVDSADITLVLGAAASATLRIVNRQFDTLSGARIKAMHVNGFFTVTVEDLAEHGFPLLRSGDNGELVAPDLPAGGHLQLVVSHIAHADTFVPYLPVRERRQEVMMNPGTPLTGRVTAGDTPVTRARVSIRQLGQGGQRLFAEALTDEDGFFSTRVAEGEYRIAASHPDHGAPEPAALTVIEGSGGESVEIRMRPPRQITGSVAGPDGSGAGGVAVAFRHGQTIHAETLTQRNGRFQLQVGAAEGVVAIQPPPGYMTETLPEMPVEFGDARILRVGTTRLVELPRIAGVVEDADGEPARNALIRSLDPELPYWNLTGPEGEFELRFEFMPAQETIALRFEHGRRFQRADAGIALREIPELLRVRLEPYEAAVEARPTAQNINTLEPLVGKAAPPIAGQEWFNTQALAIEDLRGKVVVLNFWGGFDMSAYGLNRLLELNLLHQLFRDMPDVAFVGIHDASSETAEIESFIARYDIAYPVARDDDPFVSFVNYGINFIPQTVLIDKEGILRYHDVDGRLLEMIKLLLRRG